MKAILKQKGTQFYIKYIHDEYIIVNDKKTKLQRDSFKQIAENEGWAIKSKYGLSVENSVLKNGAEFWEYEIN